MRRTRVRFSVELDLDPVPGFNHDVQDFAQRTGAQLERSIPWYRPSVSRAEIVAPEEATQQS